MKKPSIVLLLLLGGCSSTHDNASAPPGDASTPAPTLAPAPAPPAAAPAAEPASAPLIPSGVAVVVEADQTDSVLHCAPLQGFPVHSDTETAFQHLSSASQRRAFLVGLGDHGRLCTGFGKDCGTVTTAMTPHDASDWEGFANSIQGKFSRLTVLGCNAGAGQDGADLVTRMAEETQATVKAPTELVWCEDNSLTLDSDNQWVEARPGRPARATHARHTVPVLENYSLFLDGQWKLVPAKSVHVVKFSYGEFPPYKGGVVATDEARSLLPLVDWGHPFKKHARPLAVVTGRIELSVAVEGSHPITKALILYADSLVADSEAEDFYYRTDTRLHERLRKLRLSGPRPHG